MFWLVLFGILVVCAFVATLIDTVPVEGWIILLLIILAIIIISVWKNKRKKKKKIESPEFQEMLYKVCRLKDICQRMPERMGDLYIEEYDVLDYKPIHAYPGNNKKSFTRENAKESKACRIFFQVSLNDDVSIIKRAIDRIHEGDQKYAHDSNMMKIHRQVNEEHILKQLFASEADAKEFMKLSGYDATDIAFDCIDQHPMFKDWLVFHFELFCQKFSTDKEMLYMLLKEIRKGESSKKKPKKQKVDKEQKLTKVPTYGQDNRQIYQCLCGTKFRVPTDKGHIVARCPKCRRKWDING